MEVNEILPQLRAHVAPFIGAARADDVAPDRCLHELGLDSMGLVDLLVFVEKRFGVSLLAAGVRQDDLASLAALASKIAEHSAAQAGERV